VGYQESFITTTNKRNFNKFIERIKTVGKEFYEYHDTHPAFIVHIKKDISGTYNESVVLKKDKKYIYFCGERFLQKSPSRILNIQDKDDPDFTIENDITNTNLEKIPFGLKNVYVEEINTVQIFDTTKNIDGAIYSGLNNQWMEVKDFTF
jgi:hypothetical protein